MKKNLVYLVALFTFFIGVTECFGATITNYGAVTGFDLTSGNTYTCGSDSKSVLKLLDENNINYYTTSCSSNFPCSDLNNTENTCVGESGYIYEETKACYVTCDNLSSNPSNDTEIGNHQHTIWDNLSKYQKTSCEVDRINPTDLQNAIDKLISNNVCSTSSSFYILQEYKHNESDSTVVSVNNVNEMCSPQIKIKKECVGFSSGKFNVKVGEETISLSCGETSEGIDVTPNTPISIEELNSEGYMVYYSDNLVNGTISVNSGVQTVTIKNIVGNVNLTKTNGTNNSPMKGIVFSLEKQVNGEWVKATDTSGNIIGDMATNSDGKLSFSGLLTGKYRVVEVSDSNGNYIASDPVEFTIDKDLADENYSKKLDIINNPFKLKLRNVDSLGNNLSDAVFMIQKLNKDGVPENVSEVTIENGEKDIYIEKTGSYIITEIQAPLGYDILNNSIEINLENGKLGEYTIVTNFVTVSEENNILTIKIINDKSKVNFYKRDSATGKILSGAKFTLKKADGTILSEFQTLNGAFATQLAPGNYILSEIEAPKGYDPIKENFEFIVKEDGTIEAVTNNVLFEIYGMDINVYNVKPTVVPDTGIGLNILLTVVGISLLGGGSYIVYKNVKKSKNVK